MSAISTKSRVTLTVLGSIVTVVFLAGAFYAQGNTTAEKVEKLETKGEARDSQIVEMDKKLTGIQKDMKRVLHRLKIDDDE